MASPATEIDAGGRALRVSSPDRVIYEATAITGEVTKLMVVEYYVAVADGIMRALRERPTALERWPKGVREGMKLATGYADRDADAFYQKRMMRGAPDYVEAATVMFPSGRTAEEVCPTEIAVPAWAAQMGTITFHPWPVPPRRRRPSRRAAHRPRPAAGHRLRGRGRVALVARDLLTDLGLVGFPKTSRQPGRARLRADRATVGLRRRTACRDRVRA